MAKKIETDVEWLDVDADTFAPGLAKLYAKYKAQYELLKEARDAFEHAFAADVSLPAGKRVAFSYKFGKLRVGVVDAGKAAKSSKAVSYADWQASQERSGRRT